MSGCDFSNMDVAFVPAIGGALKKTILNLKDMDLVGSFAPQYLAVEKSLYLHLRKINVNGRAIALNHP